MKTKTSKPKSGSACLIMLIAAAFIQLHAPDGQIIYLNPDQITNLRKPRGQDQQHFIKGTNCVVFTTDGKYISVYESCEQIRKALGQ